MSFARIEILGRLGADPETREVSGRQVCNFSLAVSERYTTSSGQRREHVDWFRCSAWARNEREAISRLKCGSLVLITGKPMVKEWIDRDGQKRKALEVRVEKVHLLGGRDEPQA
tara:strand:+ start:206 stop:547 length:342 start_codon:yes stop_codon:yes gene_type:complete